jgi:hypothetical protein
MKWKAWNTMAIIVVVFGFLPSQVCGNPLADFVNWMFRGTHTKQEPKIDDPKREAPQRGGEADSSTSPREGNTMNPEGEDTEEAASTSPKRGDAVKPKIDLKVLYDLEEKYKPLIANLKDRNLANELKNFFDPTNMCSYLRKDEREDLRDEVKRFGRKLKNVEGFENFENDVLQYLGEHVGNFDLLFPPR